MSRGKSGLGIGSLVVVGVLMAGCSRSPDLNSPAVQQAWLRANDEKIIEILRTKGIRMDKTGESPMKVATYSRHGDGVCVIFVDDKNDPPQAVTAAYLLPQSEDGSFWRIAGYVSAVGEGGALKTATFERSITDRRTPDVAFELDRYLMRRGIEREKLPGERVMSLFH